MKVYIVRRGHPDFAVDAPTIADAIVIYWMTTKETPKASYRVHHGRRRQSKNISSAVAYWRLDAKLKSRLFAVLEETATEKQFTKFCDTAVQAASLLGY